MECASQLIEENVNEDEFDDIQVGEKKNGNFSKNDQVNIPLFNRI